MDLFQGLTAARELSHDRFDGGRPNEGLRSLIPDLQEFFDRGDQVGHAEERVAADALAGELSKPALDQVQPTGTGGHEMQHETRMLLQPGLDFGLGVA